jgi:hypothetical protein
VQTAFVSKEVNKYAPTQYLTFGADEEKIKSEFVDNNFLTAAIKC